MNKKTYLKEWSDIIQKNIWQREIFIKMKGIDKDAKQEEIDALKYNNIKDQAVVDFIANELKD